MLAVFIEHVREVVHCFICGLVICLCCFCSIQMFYLGQFFFNRVFMVQEVLVIFFNLCVSI